MSEKIVIAQRNLVCDLCGHLIPKGTQCRMIRDDYLRNIVYFEHLQCPTAVKTSLNLPKTWIIYTVAKAILFGNAVVIAEMKHMPLPDLCGMVQSFRAAVFPNAEEKCIPIGEEVSQSHRTDIGKFLFPVLPNHTVTKENIVLLWRRFSDGNLPLGRLFITSTKISLTIGRKIFKFCREESMRHFMRHFLPEVLYEPHETAELSRASSHC